MSILKVAFRGANENVRPVAFVRSMIFGIVQLVCNLEPQDEVVWIMAVPQQLATLEHFDQTSAAVHPALCTATNAIVRNCLFSKGCGTNYECFQVLEWF